MELLANPLPVSVIAEMLGVPDSDWPEIRLLVSDLALALEPSSDVEDLKRAEVASAAMWRYFAQLMADRRRHPADDLLSALIEANDNHDRLSDGEILAVATLLFTAGAETTTNLIGNGLNALFNHPDQHARLWADPALVPTAVDEILRFDSPVQLDGRQCLQEAEVAGVRFAPGDRVLTLLGAANRDPSHFDDPERFDVGRQGEAIMSFASGIHYCLGANLARAEGQEVLAGLVRRFADIAPAGERPYRRRLVLRGLRPAPSPSDPADRIVLKNAFSAVIGETRGRPGNTNSQPFQPCLARTTAPSGQRPSPDTGPVRTNGPARTKGSHPEQPVTRSRWTLPVVVDSTLRVDGAGAAQAEAAWRISVRSWGCRPPGRRRCSYGPWRRASSRSGRRPNRWPPIHPARARP